MSLQVISTLPTAVRRAESSKQRRLTNYEILRRIALRGDLEAFAGIAALDHENDEQAFDRTVEILGAEWLQKGGAL